MIKVVYLFHRKGDLSVGDFQNYWRTTHADLARRVPRVRRCVQCQTLISGYRRPTPPPLDGVEEIGFDSIADLASLTETTAGRAVMADLANFVDAERLRHIVTEEIEIKPGKVREDMVKNIELVTRKSGMAIPEFHAYWRDVHGPLAAKIDVIRRYVQSHTLMSEYEKGTPPYDADYWPHLTPGVKYAIKAHA